MGGWLAGFGTPEGKEQLLALLPFAVGGVLALSLVAAAWLRPLFRFSVAVAGAAALLALGIYRDEFAEVMFNAAML